MLARRRSAWAMHLERPPNPSWRAARRCVWQTLAGEQPLKRVVDVEASIRTRSPGMLKHVPRSGRLRLQHHVDSSLAVPFVGQATQDKLETLPASWADQCGMAEWPHELSISSLIRSLVIPWKTSAPPEMLSTRRRCLLVARSSKPSPIVVRLKSTCSDCEYILAI